MARCIARTAVTCARRSHQTMLIHLACTNWTTVSLIKVAHLNLDRRLRAWWQRCHVGTHCGLTIGAVREHGQLQLPFVLWLCVCKALHACLQRLNHCWPQLLSRQQHLRPRMLLGTRTYRCLQHYLNWYLQRLHDVRLQLLLASPGQCMPAIERSETQNSICLTTLCNRTVLQHLWQAM